MFVAPDHESQVTTRFVPQPPPVGSEVYKSMDKVAIDLDHILLVQEKQQGVGETISALVQKLNGEDSSRPVFKETQRVPELTEEQLRHAFSVIPSDYSTLNCWSCRPEGHSTFICPNLTAQLRVFFAYRYYLNQIDTNPQMGRFLMETYNRRRTDRTRTGGYNKNPPGNRNQRRGGWSRPCPPTSRAPGRFGPPKTGVLDIPDMVKHTLQELGVPKVLTREQAQPTWAEPVQKLSGEENESG